MNCLRLRPNSLLLPALVLLGATSWMGCPPEPPVPTKPDCTTSADCKGLAEDIGTLCKDGKCVACAAPTDCAGDARYGAGAVCVAGLCTNCIDGETGCACLDSQYCTEGAGCTDGVCQPCARGAASCPCRDGACDNGLNCAEDRCVPAGCSDGSEGCTCGVDDACDADLVCGDGTCHACPINTEGCPCAQGSCDIDLVCDDTSQRCRVATSCTELACGAQRLCDNSGGQYHCLDECASGYRWNSSLQQCEAIPHANCQASAEASILADCDGKHRVCVEDTAGAHCGPCFSEVSSCFIGPDAEVDGVCRAAVSCGDCTLQHRDCTAATGCGDATCGACVVGYHDDGGTCVAHTYTGCSDCISCPACSDAHRACASDSGGVYCSDCLPHWTDSAGTCVAVLNCEVGADNSIAQDCTDTHRLCVEATLLEDAQCGDCATGYLYDADSDLCIPNTPCTSDDMCPTASGFHCVQFDVTNAAYCRKSQCPQSGQVWDRYNQSCKTCSLSCVAGTALTGDLWPVTDRNGNCYCETQPGYFWDSGTSGGVAVECDRDGDGWVNQKVYQIRVASLAEYGAFQDDWTPVLNARCDLKQVFQFSLVNEWGQQKVLDVAATFGTLTGGRDHVVLYETTRNDRDDQNALPTYGARRFVPAEVNSPTKVCMDSPVDLNQNGSTDQVESHNVSTGEDWQKVFNKLGYYTELYSGYFDAGTYFIVERSRCDAGFPLGYAIEDPATDAYWQSCSRRRDSAFDVNDLKAYDFAEYDCSTAAGACTYSWDAAWRPRTSPRTPAPPAGIGSYAAIPAHGLCDGLAVTDDPWRGMTHYSQFRCGVMRVSPDPSDPTLVDIDDITYLDTVPATPSVVHRPYHLNQCGFASGSASDITCDQVIDRSVITSSAVQDHVAWVARSYDGYDYDADYTGGCINEWVEWRQMCPGFLDVSDPDASIRGAGRLEAFGALTCGCDYNYGGIGCEIGCPGANPLNGSYDPGVDPTYLFLSSDYSLGPRSGYWLCGAVQASEGTPLRENPDAGSGDAQGSGYTLRGYVPAQVTATTPLCQNAVDGGCGATGYAIHPSVLP
ncbi:MAG: hypothetical protein ABIJ09_24510 [Pseudomonadota bacterium]